LPNSIDMSGEGGTNMVLLSLCVSICVLWWVLRSFILPTVRRLRWSPNPNLLRNKVAIVTGASRGVGKGIAIGLGEAGATVYVTGRTLDPAQSLLPGTINETAQLVTEAGGKGIPVQCDHGNDDEVKALIDRVIKEQGKIDILVNNAFMTPEASARTTQVFWEQGWTYWDACHRVGLRSHYVAACLAAREMVKRKSGLIVNISSIGGKRYFFNVAYGVGKAAVDRMAKDMAHDLKNFNVAAVSLWPGLVKTERFLKNKERLLQKYKMDVDRGETPLYSGRAIAALAADPKLMKKSGKIWNVTDLAVEYGFTDVDGRQPAQVYSLRFMLENGASYLLHRLFPRKSVAATSTAPEATATVAAAGPPDPTQQESKRKKDQ
jgi:dehydrogenase/reductase SDR family protein 1